MNPVPSVLLGLVRSFVGLFEQDSCVQRSVGRGDADTSRDIELNLVHDEWFGQRTADPFGDIRRRSGGIVNQQDHEFIPPAACDQGTVADNVVEAARQGNEETVTNEVSVGVVDRFEMVKIDKHHRNRAVTLGRRFQAVLKLCSVGQLR